MVILSTDDVGESIRSYTQITGMVLKPRDGAHVAALDGRSVTFNDCAGSQHRKSALGLGVDTGASPAV